MPGERFDFDVVIGGAGPAGAALAARLAAKDPALARRTLVLDRARFPRPKPCGGGLTGHALEAMAALGLELQVPWSEAPGARVRFGAFERRVALPRPVRIVRREELDASLVAQARERGACVGEGESIEDFRVEDGGVTVRTSARRLRARVLVGADGAGSLVRRRLGPRSPAPVRLFRAEIAAPAGWEGQGEVVYDFTPMRAGLRGYLWVFPSPAGRLNVGVMHYPSRRLGGTALRRVLEHGLREHGLSVGRSGVDGWPAWGYSPTIAAAAPHVLVLGDALGIDSLTGEGIAVAMEQAIVAGDVIAQALDKGDLGLAGYRQSIRRATVGRELNLDRWMARFLYAPRLWRLWLPLALFDETILELYAARVAGSLVLVDHKAELIRALARHALLWPWRAVRLGRAAAGQRA